jgi:hypothetical protein
MKNARHKAASIIKQNPQLGSQDREYADIDDVLDFFDDLGFFVRGHQISPEIAHQFFYEWIRGYYAWTADSYIRVTQNDYPTQWEYVHQLYSLTSDIESKRLKKSNAHCKF